MPKIPSYITLLFFFSLSGIESQAQDFFLFDTTQYTTPFPSTSIDRRVIDLNTCEISTTTSEIPDAGYPLNPPDVTIAGGTPNSFLLSRGNFDNQPDDVIGHSPGVLNGPNLIMGIPFAPETLPMGLATDYDRNIFMVGEQGLSFIDGANLDADYIDDLPANFRPRGQMTFREGSFYYPSINHELIQLKVDINHNFYLRSVGSLPDTLLYGGLFSIPETCDSTTTYLVHRAPDIGSTIYVLDVANATISEHCRMQFKAISAAYNGENTLPPCDEYLLDLNTFDPTTLNRNDSICSGTVSLLDNQISLSPNLEFDSISIELQNGLDGADEWLTISGTHPEVLISGNNTNSVTLASTGFTKSGPLLAVLSSLSYTNSSLMPTAGQRVIAVTVHHPFHGVVSAYIFVEVVAGTLTIVPSLSMPTCFGDSNGSIELDVTGTTPYSLIWENGSSQIIRDQLFSGIYSYQIQDEAGCRYGDTLTLSQPGTLTATISTTNDTICGETGILTANLQGGTPNYEYSWSSGGQDSSESMLSSGNYSLTVTDENGCEALAEYTLIEGETVFTNIEQQSCLGTSIVFNNQSFTQDTTFQQLLITPTGCDSLLDVQLTFFDTFYSYSAFEICPGESVSLYGNTFTQDTSFLVTLQTQQGCDSLEHYEVSLIPPAITPASAAICQGESYVFAGQALTDTGVYYDTLMTVSGCDSLIELTLTVQPIPEIEINQQGSLCNGEEVALSVDNNLTDIIWSDGSGGSSLTVLSAGAYAVTVTDVNGCAGSAAITITDEPPVLNFQVVNPACPDGEGQLEILDLSGGVPPYQIQPLGALVSVGDFLGGFAIGSYDYTLEDAAGCVTMLSFQIQAENELAVDLPADLSIKLGESISIPVSTSFQPDLISWTPPEGLDCSDCLTPVASPIETTRYFLYLEDANDCSWEGNIVVKVEVPGLYIPNAFSPNGDGSNDVFRLERNDAVAEISSFSVYDRWGAQVFATTDTQMGWDGRIDGQLAPPGVYVYFVAWVDKAGNSRKEAGEVLLVR